MSHLEGREENTTSFLNKSVHLVHNRNFKQRIFQMAVVIGGAGLGIAVGAGNKPIRLVARQRTTWRLHRAAK